MMQRSKKIDELYKSIKSQVGLLAILTGQTDMFISHEYIDSKTMLDGLIPSLDYLSRIRYDLMMLNIEGIIQDWKIGRLNLLKIKTGEYKGIGEYNG